MQFPARFTPSLTGDEDFPSDGDRLILLIEKFWVLPSGRGVTLDEWQRWLLRHALETYPECHPLAGRLRWRQVLISMGRQNGKSELAAWLALYGLFQHVRGPSVLGVSQNVDQANIIYRRLAHTINSQPKLNGLIKATGTRGIQFKDGSGSYTIKPAKEESLQGFYATWAVADELHLLKRSLWDAIVNGQRAQPDSMLVGITTAGDMTSELLLSLYETADAAVDTGEGRFGAFIWEAPEGAELKDPAAAMAANPAMEAGRIDAATVIADTATEPSFSRRRYLHNRFVSNINSWVDMALWNKCGDRSTVVRPGPSTWYAVDIAKDLSYASVAAARRREDGRVETELVASLPSPSVEDLKELTGRLGQSAGFVMDPYHLGDLAEHLEARGRRVMRVKLKENVAAASTVHGLIAKGRVRHGKNALVKHQMGMGKAIAKGDTWRIGMVKKGEPIDALMATVFAVWAAEVNRVEAAPLIALAG